MSTVKSNRAVWLLVQNFNTDVKYSYYISILRHVYGLLITTPYLYSLQVFCIWERYKHGIQDVFHIILYLHNMQPEITVLRSSCISYG